MDPNLNDASMEWVAVADAGDLAPGTLRKLSLRGLNLALGATARGPFALEDSCAHEGASLSLGSLDGENLVCPLHGYRTDVSTGRCQQDSRLCQRRYEAKWEGGKAWVRVPLMPVKAVATPVDPAKTRSSVELWKSEKHPLDCWDDLLRFAKAGTPQASLSVAELERMKWFGFYHRKANDPDHYMTRVRIPGCSMNAAQLRALAFIAYESGHALLDVTTRGNIQIQGLSVEKLPGVAAALESVGLTAQQSGHDNVRNITSLPMAGLDPDELIDTRPLARRLQALIIGHREFSDLPRKFNPAFSGRPDAPGHAWTQDLSFVAARKTDGSVAFRPLLGGSQGQSPTLAWAAPVWVEADRVIEFTTAVMQVFRDKGWRHNRHQVRLHFLMERLGNEAFLGLVQESLGYALEACQESLPEAERDETLLGRLPQRQAGLWALGVCVPVGRLDWKQAEGLASLAERYGDGEIRSSTDQNLLLTGIPFSRLADAETALAALGLSPEADSLVRNMVACTGKQFCNLAIGETKGYAFQLIEELRRRRVQLQGITVHMSGCPNSCGMTLTADIGLQGTKVRRLGRSVDAFDVFLGGGLGGQLVLARLFRKGVPTDELAHFLDGRIAQYRAQRNDGESFSGFWRRQMDAAPPDFSAEAPRRWACGGCGYHAVGEVAPSFCPVCSAVRALFEPADEAAMAPAAEMPAPPVAPAKVAITARRIVVVGGGIAAHVAAEEARATDPGAQITLISAESRYYNRLSLTRFMAQEIGRDQLFDYDEAWYAERRLNLRRGKRVEGLLSGPRRLVLEGGEEVPFDSCILAQGASASLPVFFRQGLPNLVALRSLEEADRLAGQFEGGAHLVVVGGGVLGVETACAAAKGGAQVTLVELEGRLMPRQLDEEASQLLQAHLESLGIRIRLGSGIREAKGVQRLERLVFTDGGEMIADLVAVCTGITPNVAWLRGAGLDCGRGVRVDDQMRSSVEAVFACGDVAEWRGQVFGLWSNALEQAQVAGRAAAGGSAHYNGTLPVTVLKCAGVDCISLGEVPAPGPGVASRGLRQKNAYRRLYLRDGMPVGAVLFGTAQGLADWRKLVADGQALERLQRSLLPLESMVGL